MKLSVGAYHNLSNYLAMFLMILLLNSDMRVVCGIVIHYLVEYLYKVSN